MNNLNSILIEGNLVKDPMLRSTTKGTQICLMRIASNRFYKQDSKAPTFEKEVSFFDVESWARLAENCYMKGRKGRGVRVVGRLKEDRWNAADGKTHSRVSIVAEHVEFRPDFKKETQIGYPKTAAEIIAAEPEIPYGEDSETNLVISEPEELEAVLC